MQSVLGDTGELANVEEVRRGGEGKEKRRGGPGEHKERSEEHRICAALRDVISV